MFKSMLIKMQVNTQDKGELQVNIVDSENAPIKDARVIIRKPRILPEQPINSGDMIEELNTDISGQTQVVDLDAPPLEYSLNENNEEMPYANYDVEIDAPGYEVENVENVDNLEDKIISN